MASARSGTRHERPIPLASASDRPGNAVSSPVRQSPGHLSHLFGPLASVRDGRIQVAPQLADHPRKQHVLAHEAVHVAQFRAWQSGAPEGSRSDLEREAEAGAHRIAAGVGTSPRWGAPRGLTLNYDPPPVFAAPMDQPAADAAQADSGTHGSSPPPNANLVRLRPEDVDLPGRDDILVMIAGGHLVALPARSSVVFPKGSPATATAPVAAATPLVSVPTIAKEGLRVVNVGSGTGVVLDAGGRPAVVFAGPLAEAMGALGVSRIRSVVVMHLHQDHVTSLAELIRTQGISPNNVHYPAAFEINASAPTSDFARQIAAVRGRLGAGTTFQTIPTPTSGLYFHNQLIEGNVRLDMYGITAAFQQLEADRRASRAQPGADRASLLVRATHEPTGTAVLFLGDLRGEDLTAFRQAMGTRFEEVTRGVRVISGFQHHMGALESGGDQTGLRELLSATYLRTGSLSLVIQSQETRSGRQYLNRSLIAGLNQMGVDVHLAMDPGGSAGAITVNTDNTVRHSGGRTETHPGSDTVRRHVRSLVQLEEAHDTLSRYGRHAPGAEEFRRVVEGSRDRLRTKLSSYLDLVLGGVRTGGSGRAQQSLANPDQIRAAEGDLDRLQYRLMMPAEMRDLRELRRLGPHLDTLEREMRDARRTGRLSQAGIEALWEVSPQRARQLVQGSKLPRREQQRVLRQVPGQPMGARGRWVGGALIAISLFNEAAPLIQAEQARSYDRDVARFLGDILFWQGAGVTPAVQAVDDNQWPYENEWTTDPARISALLAEREVSYLAVTGIEESQWDAFMIWAQSSIQNYGDWQALISDNDALRASGDYIDQLEWSYRTGRITGTTFGHDLDVEWVHSPRLTTILRAAAAAMVSQSREEIAAVATAPGPRSQTTISAIGSHVGRALYSDMPQANRVARFRTTIATPTLYTYRGQRERTGVSPNARLYVFPDSAYDGELPNGYVLVGGADYNTYVTIAAGPNQVDRSFVDRYGIVRTYTTRGRSPLMLARSEDLEEIR